jgi:hypothetical protein
VNGQGFLVPGKPEANVTVYFVNPDGVADDLQVVTANRGAFSFTYTPNKTGNWTVTAVWDSDKYYWDSAYSLHTNLEVVAPEPPTNDGTEIVPWLPVEYYYVLALVIAVAVILVAVIVLKKRRKVGRRSA